MFDVAGEVERSDVPIVLRTWDGDLEKGLCGLHAVGVTRGV